MRKRELPEVMYVVMPEASQFDVAGRRRGLRLVKRPEYRGFPDKEAAMEAAETMASKLHTPVSIIAFVPQLLVRKRPRMEEEEGVRS